MEWYVYVVIALLALGLEAVIWKLVDWIQAQKNKPDLPPSLPPLSKEEKISLLKYGGLDDCKDIERLFFGKNETQRILFLKHKDHFTVQTEALELFDDEEVFYATDYGVWVDTTEFAYVYDSLETALKEWKNKLQLYREETPPRSDA